MNFEIISEFSTEDTNLNQYEYTEVVLDHSIKIHVRVNDSDTVIINSSISDRIAYVYEGGMKIWDCSIDLCSFLIINIHKIFKPDMTIMELGCGNSIPTLAFLKSAYKNFGSQCLCNINLIFQDFNRQVLEQATKPNVKKLLFELDRFPKRAFFIAGSWENFCNLPFDKINIQKVDLILASEVIYNSDTYSALLKLLELMLNDNGFVLIATKIYYFGDSDQKFVHLNGSLYEFIDAVKQRSNFRYKVVWQSSSDLNRYILELSKVNSAF